MFSNTLRLWKQFEAAAGAKHGTQFNSNASAEMGERLKQLSFFANHTLRCADLMAKAERAMSKKIWEADCNPHEIFLQSMEPLFELRAYVEAFYYFAFRVLKVARRGFPELAQFESIGVRLVRNHLIEHPEKKSSRALVWSFGFDEQKGAILKSGQPIKGTTAFEDPGFTANAEEFRTNLELLLVHALK
jgi:hypothetical protein